MRLGGRDWLALVVCCVGAGTVALAIATRLPDAGLTSAIGLAVGLPAVGYLALSRRYGMTLALLALYIGLLDGVIKMRTGVQAASLLRDVLIAAVAGGALARLLHERRMPVMPPLTPWVVGFCVLVVLQVFNPNTLGLTKALAGIRQHLEWVPLFFFAFALLRTKHALRNLAILIGVIAALNGVVGLVQFQLSPDELASWGPGYAERIRGSDELGGRAFLDESGGEHVRPFGLGSDMGFAGMVGVIAAPMVLALLATGRLARRWWLGGLLAAGILAGVLTSQSRSAMIGAVVAILAFAALGMAGARLSRALGALALVAALAWLVVPTIAANAGPGTFDRYATIAPGKVLGTAYDYREDDNDELGRLVSEFPLGGGLGTVGPARGFGGGERPFETRYEAFNGETHFNYLAIELGVPGLLLFTAFQALLLFLVMTRLRRIPDRDVRTYVAGALAPCFVILAGGLGGPTMSAPPFAPWFWVTAGLAAYWLCQTRPVDTPRKP
jgi:hypothetical protein